MFSRPWWRPALTAVAAFSLSAGLLAAPAQAAPSVAVAGVQAAPSVAVAGVRATPGRQAGRCPAAVVFSATVTVKGAARVKYRWVRGDGTKGAVRTAKAGTGIKLQERRTFSRSTRGWQAVQVLSPKKLTSGRAHFSVTCQGSTDVETPRSPAEGQGPAPRASAEVAGGNTYSGPCAAPGRTIDFVGTIRVSRVPAAVSYRWADSDGGPLGRQDLWFSAKDSPRRTVGASRTFLAGQSGTRWIEILDRHGKVLSTSAKVPYSVTCTPTPAPVTASVTGVRVDPAAYRGTCAAPLTFTFTADLAVSKPAKVTYRWIRGDGTTVPGEWEFKDAKDLTKTVSLTWPVADPAKVAGGSATVQITSPGRSEAGPAKFTITCEDTGPGTVTVSDPVITTWSRGGGECTTQNPYQVTAASMITAPKGAGFPLDVTYRWRWADGGYWHKETVKITGPGPHRVAHQWFVQRSQAGKVFVDVLTPTPVKSGTTEYSVTCDGRPPVPNTGGVVTSVTDAKITPSSHTGTCPVDLKAVATITVSAPTSGPVEYAWVFDNGTSSPTAQVDFPAGGPLTKTVVWDEWRAVKTSGPVTGYLRTVTPNTAVSSPVSYSVTCA